MTAFQRQIVDRLRIIQATSGNIAIYCTDRDSEGCLLHELLLELERQIQGTIALSIQGVSSAEQGNTLPLRAPQCSECGELQRDCTLKQHLRVS